MKLRPFELALVIIFGGLALTTLVMLKVYDPPPDEEDELRAAIGVVQIWGTLPAAGVNDYLSELREQNDAYGQISYRHIRPEQFDDMLVTALADGVGPDLILVSHEKLAAQRHRIQPISYESFPLRDVQDRYVDGAQIFALSDGLYGYPIAVDPLMMYWNRDLLTTTGYLDAPATWEEVVNDVFPDMIQRGFDRSVQRSVVAMGEYGNVRNAFGILSALLLQGGSEGVVEAAGGEYRVRLQSSVSGKTDPLRAAADFYTRFSRPSNALYSWNRAFNEDRRQFVSEELVFYFGYGSEGEVIEQINPNVSFDIAEIPQGATATVRRTYGKFYGLSLLRSTDNPQGAVVVMGDLGSQAKASEIAVRSNMAPAYRAAIAAGSNDIYGRVIFKSAAIAAGWLNPSLEAANDIFEQMTEDINENRRDVSGAVTDASSRLAEEY